MPSTFTNTATLETRDNLGRGGHQINKYKKVSDCKKNAYENTYTYTLEIHGAYNKNTSLNIFALRLVSFG